MSRFTSALLLILISIFLIINICSANDPAFRDQKDIARLTTCTGPCLKDYPGTKDFIMKYSFYISGLQTMFTGGDPLITVYNDDESVKEEIPVGDKSAEEILKVVQDAGCTYMGA